MEGQAGFESKNDDVILARNERNDEMWMIKNDIEEAVDQFYEVDYIDQAQAAEIMSLIRRREARRSEYLAHFNKYLETLYKTHNASKAISIQKYYQAATKLKSVGYRFPEVRTEADLDRVASVRIGRSGTILATEITIPAVRPGHIELWGMNTYKVKQAMSARSSLQIKTCGEYLLVEGKKTACINEEELKKCKNLGNVGAMAWIGAIILTAISIRDARKTRGMYNADEEAIQVEGRAKAEEPINDYIKMCETTV
ncbi:hypothetical protein TKK_0005594 [Trichogramma kaykai]